MSGWDVSNGTNFYYLYTSARAFTSDLSSWDLSSVSSTTGMQDIFANSGMDCYNLSNTIIGWANNPNTPSGQTGINLTGLSYNAAADAALNNILNTNVANDGRLCFNKLTIIYYIIHHSSNLQEYL